MKWRTSKQKKMGVAWYQIEKELTIIDDISTEPLWLSLKTWGN